MAWLHRTAHRAPSIIGASCESLLALALLGLLSMVCDLTHRTKRPILVAVPQGLKAAYGALDGSFEGTTAIGGTTYDLLRFYPDPVGGYRQRQRDLEAKGLRYGYRGATFTTYIPTQDVEIEFTARLRTAELSILLEVQQIQAAAGTLITIHDYARPSFADLKTAIAATQEPYTVRQGELTITELGQFRGTATGRKSEEEPIRMLFKQVG